MAFSKGDEVYVSSSKKQYRGVVRSVNGTAVEVMIGRQVVPCQEVDCTAVPPEERTLTADLPSGLTPPVAYDSPNPADLGNMMSQETRDKHVADRDALKALIDAEADEGVTPRGS